MVLSLVLSKCHFRKRFPTIFAPKRIVVVPKNANITVVLVLVNNSMEIHLNLVSGRTCLHFTLVLKV